VWTVCVVVVVVAYTPCSPELPSDLEDSDSRFTGKARVELASSPYAGGECPTCVWGRSGSSNVTLPLLPEGAVSDIVFLLSFFSFLVTLNGIGASSVGGVSEEVFARLVIFILDFLTGLAALISIVGAVVMISGGCGSGGASA
jgi:hypothetical protein